MRSLFGFYGIGDQPLQAADISLLFLSALGILAGAGLLVWIYGFVFRLRSCGFALPVLFMNAGNMGPRWPFFRLGNPAVRDFFNFSIFFGNLHPGGRGNWREIFRLPLIYATCLGLAFNLGQIQIAQVIFEPLSMLGYSTIPLMLVSLGYRLHDVKSLRLGHALGGAALRIIGGFFVAYITVTVLEAEAVNRRLILLYGSLPSAVVNFVLTEKYGQDPDLAASIVVLSTLFSIVTIPVVFWIIL